MMKRIDRRRLFSHGVFLLLFFLLWTPVTKGQFYQGHQMTFGKNRVQYNQFFWSFYRFENFDVYFNEYGRPLAEYTSEVAKKKLYETEDYFDYTLNNRLIFIVYNKLSDFRQSNIGLVEGEDETNVGGVRYVLENKVFLFYPGDHVDYDREIGAAIAQVLINEMLNKGDKREKVSSSAKYDLPDWFVNGLISYVSDPWNAKMQNRIKDGILTGHYKKLNHLEREDAVIAGHSFWKYIADEYGDAVIPNILYMTRMEKNLEKGFLNVLGVSIQDLSKDWVSYYQKIFRPDEENREQPAGVPLLKKTKARHVYNRIRVSPDGSKIAYVTNELGRYKIWIYDVNTGKRKKIYAHEPKVEQIIDYTYPVLGWYPNSEMLTFIVEQTGGLKMFFYRLSSGKKEEVNLLYFEKILDLDFSDDGSRMVFSAVKNGQTDLYVYDIASGTYEQLTNDLDDDLHPRFINHSEQIIFSSNRASDTLRRETISGYKPLPYHDLFIYDYQKRSKALMRFSEGKYADKSYPGQAAAQDFLYLSNANGIYNRYIAHFDSGIAYIDTAIHYRYFTTSVPLTNYSRDILEQDYEQGSGEAGDIVFSDGRYIPEKEEPDLRAMPFGKKLEPTSFRLVMDSIYAAADSLEQLRQWLIKEDKKRRDTLTKPLYSYFQDKNLIDINYYIFEQEKQNYYNSFLLGKYANIDLDTTRIHFPPIRIYETAFYKDYTANQLDFGFIGTGYQYFNGSGMYYNPGLNGLFKIGIKDLFENYKITAGIRFSADFTSNEYLVSFENLKKRIDKQAIYHRQAYKSYNYNNNSYEKVTSQQLFYSLKYPFNQVLALKGTASFRLDRMAPLSTDIANMMRPITYLPWANLRLEYIFDNTRSRGINLYNGTRFKIFGEAYYQMNQWNSEIIIFGADFRHYQRIHRDLILATRLAGSGSVGHYKLLYYLGGVDNSLMYMFNPNKSFNRAIPIDYTQNYIFQTVATDMRGFRQNIRNGSNFVLFNAELRWPVFRYLANHPLGSRFLNSFQIVGFGDVGTAWSGINPYAGQNAYDKRYIRNGPLTVILETNREPFVEGFGVGARALVFGYFLNVNLAWGVENYRVLPHIWHVSFSTDF